MTFRYYMSTNFFFDMLVFMPNGFAIPLVHDVYLVQGLSTIRVLELISASASCA